MGARLMSLDIATLQRAYRSGATTPTGVLRAILAGIAETRTYNAWISLVPEHDLLARAAALERRGARGLPLFGVPFAIKDNIDLEALPTTAACPAFTYTPQRSAPVVERLIGAGALPIGKTNMDQFATGLVGTRSPEPYGVCHNSFDPNFIAGGSSSGSAVAVALGLASFALGTDTAGSGRIPAAFNNLIGLKPTRGLLSTRGVVPACRSLDCVSLLALTSGDAERVFDIACGYDPQDDYARQAPAEVLEGGPGALVPGFRFGVPRAAQLQFFGDAEAPALFAHSVAALQALGGTAVDIDFAPFLEAAQLLYEGPWVAERYAAIRGFIERQPQALLPVIRAIIEPALGLGAVECFEAQYRLRALAGHAAVVLAGVDFVVTPTAGALYRIEQVLAEPLQRNTQLGYYTNFMNLLDCAAVAVPGGFYANGLPFGVTLFAQAFSDRRLLAAARALQQHLRLPLGASGRPLPAESAAARATPACVRLAVCGAHLQGLALNHQLTARGARLLRVTPTAPHYRLYALPGASPQRPGLVRDPHGGGAIEVEVWELPVAHFGSFVAGIAAPLCIGRIELGDGEQVSGFLCEAHAVTGAADITALGGWRAYLSSQGDLPVGRA